MSDDNSQNRRNANVHCLSEEQHRIDHQRISKGTIEVIRTLTDNHFEAYLVGGGVRDLLIDRHPKDFDVATDATPEQLVELFRRARIIGRRFRIVHIRTGREIIEVTTFRGQQQGQHTQKAKSGMLLRDNSYGTVAEDAIRRDFTVNALYYDIHNRCVYDYTSGIEDIKKRQIKTIGDPALRYREDPVRMLRAVRLASKLDFSIEDNSADCIAELKHLLRDIPPARLFDESLKLLMAGHGERTFAALQHHALFEILFPQTGALIKQDTASEKFVLTALRKTDDRLQNDKRVTPAYLFAALLWPALRAEMDYLEHHREMPFNQRLYLAAETVIEQLVVRVSLPRRFSAPMKDIWSLQFRLQRHQRRQIDKLFTHPRFRAAYDFILLREEAGEDLQGLGQWWTDFQACTDNERQQMIDNLAPEPRQAGKKRRRSRSRHTKTRRT